MALADYKLCDICGHKAFYDANLGYQFDAILADCIRGEGVELGNLGDWAVICKNCAKTHKTIIVEIEK